MPGRWTPSAASGDDKLISNFTIRCVLEAMRELDPSESHSLLAAAGLSRLKSHDLTDTAPPVVRTSELARLYGTVYRMMGEPVMRVFLANYAWRMEPMLLKHPEVVRLREKGKTIPPAQIRSWAARQLPQLLGAIWASVNLEEDPAAYYLVVERCPICIDIRKASRPICHSSECLYSAFARAITGQRLTLTEVACRAQGAPACSFKLDK